MESPPKPRCNRAVTKQIKGNATPKKHTNPMNASWKGTVEGLFFVEDSQKLKKTSSIRFLECKSQIKCELPISLFVQQFATPRCFGHESTHRESVQHSFFFPGSIAVRLWGLTGHTQKLGALRDLRILDFTVQAKFRRPLLKGPSELHWSTNENRLICPPHILSFLSSFLTQW